MTLARIATLSLAALLAAGAHAQTTDADKAANSTGTTTTQQEMNRGVPGVDVDVGRNARGAVDVDVDRNTNARNIPGVGSNNRDGTTPDATAAGSRPARADRN